MRNKLRSILTMLGIFIGVAALIAMVAVGQGANAAVEKEIEGLGTNLLIVLPGSTTASGVRGGHGSASTLTVDDALAIPHQAPSVGRVSYMVRQMGQVEYASHNWTTNIQGVTPDYLPIANWQIAEGRGLTEPDGESLALVAVLGHTVYQQLFDAHEDPLGATILIKGFALRVIGILAAKGQSGWGQDQDDLVMVPFTTTENKVLGVATPARHKLRAIPFSLLLSTHSAYSHGSPVRSTRSTFRRETPSRYRRRSARSVRFCKPATASSLVPSMTSTSAT